MELDNKYSYDAAIRGFPLLLQMLVTKKKSKAVFIRWKWKSVRCIRKKGCDVEGDMPVGHLPMEVFRNFKKLGQIRII